MHPEISRFPNSYFYHNQIADGDKVCGPSQLGGWSLGLHSVIWFGYKSSSLYFFVSLSLLRPRLIPIYIIADYLKKICFHFHKSGTFAPFRFFNVLRCSHSPLQHQNPDEAAFVVRVYDIRLVVAIGEVVPRFRVLGVKIASLANSSTDLNASRRLQMFPCILLVGHTHEHVCAHAGQPVCIALSCLSINKFPRQDWRYHILQQTEGLDQSGTAGAEEAVGNRPRLGSWFISSFESFCRCVFAFLLRSHIAAMHVPVNRFRRVEQLQSIALLLLLFF